MAQAFTRTSCICTAAEKALLASSDLGEKRQHGGECYKVREALERKYDSVKRKSGVIKMGREVKVKRLMLTNTEGERWWWDVEQIDQLTLNPV